MRNLSQIHCNVMCEGTYADLETHSQHSSHKCLTWSSYYGPPSAFQFNGLLRSRYIAVASTASNIL